MLTLLLKLYKLLRGRQLTKREKGVVMFLAVAYFLSPVDAIPEGVSLLIGPAGLLFYLEDLILLLEARREFKLPAAPSPEEDVSPP